MKDKEIKILFGLMGLVTIGYLIYENFNKPVEEQVTEIDTSPSAPRPIAPVILDKNLVLQKGSRGNEVKALQELLEVANDGIFGNQTETALNAKKGVIAISLNQYATKANINQNPLKYGDRVMAIKKPTTPTYLSNKLADGTYHIVPKVFEDFDFGKEIGVVKGLTPDKLHYLINDGSFINNMIFVRAEDVKKI